MTRVLPLLFLTILTACQGQPMKPLRYVALGDSYTIGTGAAANEAWPVLMTKHLNDAGLAVELVANPARNGFSTRDLIDFELPVFDESAADFVTLLIGVNDWVRGIDAKTYRGNLVFILDHVQGKLARPQNLLLVTIPDFGVTPQGQYYGNGRDISQGIAAFNALIQAEAAKRGLPCVDLFALSKGMGDDPSLVAADGLHPSAGEYALWERRIFTEAVKLLGPDVAQGCEPTFDDGVSPSYRPDAPARNKVGSGHVVTGTVRSSLDCRPIANASLEFWPEYVGKGHPDGARATLVTDGEGRYRFECDPPEHIHMRISAPGFRTIGQNSYHPEGKSSGTFDLVLAPSSGRS